MHARCLDFTVNILVTVLMLSKKKPWTDPGTEREMVLQGVTSTSVLEIIMPQVIIRPQSLFAVSQISSFCS